MGVGVRSLFRSGAAFMIVAAFCFLTGALNLVLGLVAHSGHLGIAVAFMSAAVVWFIIAIVVRRKNTLGNAGKARTDNITSENDEQSQELLLKRERADRDRHEGRLRFEHQLINRRLTWLLTSQSVLFAAYGFATRPQTPPTVFLIVTPIAGAVISGLILIGVVCGILAKYFAWDEFKVKYPREPFGVKTWITFVAFVPDVLLPVVFAGAWVWILLWSGD